MWQSRDWGTENLGKAADQHLHLETDIAQNVGLCQTLLSFKKALEKGYSLKRLAQVG
jgi:hypothetical protein